MREMKMRSGQVLTDALIEAMAAEAEAGFSPAQLRPLPVQRATSNDGNGPRVEFQVDSVTFEALLARAREENRGVSEIARLALERYLCDAAQPAAGSAAPVPEARAADAAPHAE